MQVVCASARVTVSSYGELRRFVPNLYLLTFNTLTGKYYPMEVFHLERQALGFLSEAAH